MFWAVWIIFSAFSRFNFLRHFMGKEVQTGDKNKGKFETIEPLTSIVQGSDGSVMHLEAFCWHCFGPLVPPESLQINLIKVLYPNPLSCVETFLFQLELSVPG